MKKLVSLMLIALIASFITGGFAECRHSWNQKGVCSVCGIQRQPGDSDTEVASVPRSYASGDSIEYEYLGSTSTLVITGSGSIQDYGSGDVTPWAGVRKDTKRIVIEADVTGIGANAFAGFTQRDLRVEFLQSAKPTISDTAFSGTTAVCRYYSKDASWTVNNSNNIRWI